MEDELPVGVGPYPGEWPTGDQFDPALLAEGDRRNVVDRYRYWRLPAIVADLDTRRHDFHVAIENWQHDFNIGTVVRTANAFLAKEVHIVGRRRWNRRGAMVTDRYQHLRYHEDPAALAAGRGLRISCSSAWTTFLERCPSSRRTCHGGASCSSARKDQDCRMRPGMPRLWSARSHSTARPGRSMRE